MKEAAASSVDRQKELAVQVHSEQAPGFAAAYSRLSRDPFATCFGYSRRRLDVLLDRDLASAASGARLLDVGCGTGEHMARMAARGFEVSGCDGSLAMLEYARAQNPGADLRQADVDRIPFPDSAFDVVICIEVLRYLPDVLPCLEELARVLRPGGLCLVTAAPLLNLNGYWAVNRLAGIVPGLRLVRLKQFFTTSAELRRSMSQAGFEPVAIRGVYWGPINWVERLAPRLLPGFLMAWERLDARVADRAFVRETANMFLARGVRA